MLRLITQVLGKAKGMTTPEVRSKDVATDVPVALE